jgi:Ca2+-binding EF-hand superfamily protein
MKLRLSIPWFAVLTSCTGGLGPVVPKTKVERQMIGLLQKFDRWDENGDGQLKAPELKEAARISGHSVTKILDFYDTDHSGGISLKEAQAGYGRVGEIKVPL